MSSQVTPTAMLKVGKLIWITLSVIVLLVTLYSFNGKPNSDIEIFLGWSMLVLAFPTSLLVALLFAGIAMAADSLYSIAIPTSYFSLLVSWIFLFATGYWQWFVLVPRLWQKWKYRDTRAAPPA